MLLNEELTSNIVALPALPLVPLSHGLKVGEDQNEPLKDYLEDSLEVLVFEIGTKCSKIVVESKNQLLLKN